MLSAREAKWLFLEGILMILWNVWDTYNNHLHLYTLYFVLHFSCQDLDGDGYPESENVRIRKNRVR